MKALKTCAHTGTYTYALQAQITHTDTLAYRYTYIDTQVTLTQRHT